MLSRGRKRPRLDDDAESLLDKVEVVLKDALPDPPGLFRVTQRLQQLHQAFEKRLVNCHVDNLTPHECLEFILRRRVRLAKVVKNDFEDEESEEEAADAKVKSERKEFVAQFQVGKDKLTLVIAAQRGPEPGSPQYTVEALLGAEDGEALLRAASWDQAKTLVHWPRWSAFQLRFGADRRSVLDFAKGVLLVSAFAELGRRFGSEASDSEDEIGAGLVSTLAICRMMVETALPMTFESFSAAAKPVPDSPEPAQKAEPVAAASAAGGKSSSDEGPGPMPQPAVGSTQDDPMNAD